MPRPPKKFRAFPFDYHHELELEIESLSNLGEGIARIELAERAPEATPAAREPVAEQTAVGEAVAGASPRWPIFVPFTLPGERVRARIFRNERNHSRADLIEVMQASPDRVAPSCPRFGECGGCQYQHLDYPAQLAWKTRQVEELLQHMAGLRHPVEPCHPSPRRLGYRSKITPHFAKPRHGIMGAIGFLPHARRSGQVDVPQCPIAMDEINQALPAIRDGARQNARHYKRGATLLLRASQGAVITNPNAVVTETVGELSFDFLAGDFFQNNPFILPAFTAHVAREAAAGGARFLVDAYCGCGLFSLALARDFQSVVGVEVSESSADWARRNATANGVENVRFLAASAEAIFGEVDFDPGLTTVITDPPRKGCSEDFLDQLRHFLPARVIYVSCNPATQMRDLGPLLAAGYRLGTIQPFDLFPHTRHLECVMTLVRA